MLRQYKHGDIRADGYRFNAYKKNKRGETIEHWLSPIAYQRNLIAHARENAKRRAKQYDVPFNVSTDYLFSIFPEDHMCPALGIPLVWGESDGTRNSPSLDRIIPGIGYVEGNLIWVSQQANIIKQDVSPEILMKVATFYLNHTVSSQ